MKWPWSWRRKTTWDADANDIQVGDTVRVVDSCCADRVGRTGVVVRVVNESVDVYGIGMIHGTRVRIIKGQSK